MNKYLLTASFRADGSSLFREENRWGYFPSAALAWKAKEESFLQNVNLVNDLKIRLGWGQTGQQDITGAVGYFPALPLFDTGSVSSQYLDGVALYSARAYNQDLTWEKTTTYNALMKNFSGCKSPPHFCKYFILKNCAAKFLECRTLFALYTKLLHYIQSRF